MLFSKRSLEGELMVDHRASPGIGADQARRMGLDPRMVRHGGVSHAPTLGCVHCGSHVVMNPDRQRERAHCMRCNAYICDSCDAARQHPDYVHRTARELAELVQSGFTFSGSMSLPVISRGRIDNG